LKTQVLTVAEMLKNIEIIRFLYPDFRKKYESYLKEMVPHNYKQLAFENEICIAVTGFWTKLWSGKYIEIDNFIVHPEHRSKGLGKMMTDYIDVKGKRRTVV
jgi:ribosomal protein S18 acetylase RimI-like enzyme